MRSLGLYFLLSLGTPALAVNLEDPNLKIGRGSEPQGQVGSINDPSTLEPIPLDKIRLLPEELLLRLPANEGEDDEEESEE